MDDKQVRITSIGQATERDILDRIVNAMLASENELRNANVHEWTRVLTASCRSQKLAARDTLATTC